MEYVSQRLCCCYCVVSLSISSLPVVSLFVHHWVMLLLSTIIDRHRLKLAMSSTFPCSCCWSCNNINNNSVWATVAVAFHLRLPGCGRCPEKWIELCCRWLTVSGLENVVGVFVCACVCCVRYVTRVMVFQHFLKHTEMLTCSTND